MSASRRISRRGFLWGLGAGPFIPSFLSSFRLLAAPAEKRVKITDVHAVDDYTLAVQDNPFYSVQPLAISNLSSDRIVNLTADYKRYQITAKLSGDLGPIAGATVSITTFPLADLPLPPKDAAARALFRQPM